MRSYVVLAALVLTAVACEGRHTLTGPEAQRAVCGVKEKVYRPNKKAQAVYAEMYGLYRTLHDAFGTREWSGKLDYVMKDLIRIRERQRSS